MEDAIVPKTLGIGPAQTGALAVLQQTKAVCHAEYEAIGATDDVAMARHDRRTVVIDAAREVASYHPATGHRAEHYRRLEDGLVDFLKVLVDQAPPGPERSTAISRAREAKMWGAAAIALEGK